MRPIRNSCLYLTVAAEVVCNVHSICIGPARANRPASGLLGLTDIKTANNHKSVSNYIIIYFILKIKLNAE